MKKPWLRLEPLHAAANDSVGASRQSATFPIVGVGASAGGLEAFTQLLSAIPSDSGMAFVLIQHLDPTHISLLAEALTRATTMTVNPAEHGQRVAPNHVYVIPPNAELGILHGVLTLLPRHNEPGKLHLPIDYFFRALAADCGTRAIGVILSGSASDGTEGLRAIKAENGITLAQDPRSAKFGGMPHSAVNAGVVDFALPIPELALELLRLSRHSYVAAEKSDAVTDQATLQQIFAIVRDAVGVDFSEYKRATFERRLARRMALRQTDGVTQYLALLQREAAEIRLLYEDVLIHVTSFFRDPEVFESLKRHLLPEILKTKADGAPIRAWVAGCSTGEEVYSLAITLLELMDGSHSHPIQMFGSDVSDRAIDRARLGVFADTAMRDVSDERRRRYFTKADTGYRISKNVRDLCVFVRHDLARDPPFSRLDLISCRNVLIYFDRPLQDRILLTFHYALNQPGFLLLGRTENVSGFDRLFSPTDHSNKTFARMPGHSALQFAPRSEAHSPPTRAAAASPGRPPARDPAKQLDRMLLARYSPPGVLINERMEIVQFRGETGAWLRPAPGDPQSHLFRMARHGLLGELRATIAKAKKRKGAARTQGVEIDEDGIKRLCNLEVLPFTGSWASKEQLWVVLFEEAAKPKPRGKQRTAGPKRPREKAQLHKLEQELAVTKEYLQSLIDDHGRTNEQLNAANEELVSSNEELQSINEELETAKEELQSTNEELSTVNDELNSRNQEVCVINSDLVNLLSTVDVPILILDIQQRIRRCTPKARNILNVLPSDVGRPLDDIKVNVLVPDLPQQINEVITTGTLHESEVQDREGRWYRMQIRPYHGTEDKIEGATLSLVDIDTLKHHIDDAELAKAEAERANVAKDQFLATLSHELRTPLSSMLMQAQMLRKGADPKSRRAGEVIERGTRLQVQLIDDLLDVSRIVTGKLKMEVEPVDLKAVILAAIEVVRASLEKKSLQLELAIEDTVGVVPGDAIRLQQVVSNLLTNAIKFTPERGQVTVTLRESLGSALLTVSDTGMGIAPEFLPYVFNRFSQEDGSNTRSFGGLGLGLAIVRHLVETHGGTVRAESPGPGKGATFSVTLPRMAGNPTPNERPTGSGSARGTEPRGPTASQPVSLQDLRVLVVDDDGPTREVLAEILAAVGAEVKAVPSTVEAMTEVGEFRPSVLVCDVAMPGEDGYSFIRRLRRLDHEHGGDIPALALTALAGDEDRRRSLSAGFQMHVSKPVDIDRLARAVRELAGAGSVTVQ